MNKSPKQLLSHPEVKLELLVLQTKFPVSPHIPALLVEFAELENDRDGSLISVCFYFFNFHSPFFGKKKQPIFIKFKK